MNNRQSPDFPAAAAPARNSTKRHCRLWLAPGSGVALTLMTASPAWAWPAGIQPPIWLEHPSWQTVFVGLLAIGLALFGWMFFTRLRNGQSAGKKRTSVDLWPELVRAVANAGTLDDVLRAALRVLTGHFGADQAWLAKYSARHERWVPVSVPQLEAGITPPPDIARELAHQLRALVASPEVVIEPGQPAGPAGDNAARHWLLVPITNNRRLLGVLALSWKGLRPRDTDVLKTAAPLGEFLSRSVSDFVSTAAAEAVRQSTRAGEALAQQLCRHRSIESALTPIVKSLWPICRPDYAAISGVDDGSIRWSALVEQGKPVEHRYPIISSGTDGKSSAGLLDEPSIDDDLMAGASAPQSIEHRLSMRSRLTIPLVWAGKNMGRLTIASRQPGRFDEVTVVRLEPLARVLAEWLQIRETERLAGRMDRYLDALDRLDQADDNERDDVAGMLRQAMDVTAVRLFRYDPADESFHLTASAFARPVGERGQNYHKVPAERLPWLRLALRGDRPCLIDQNDPERLMSTEESRLAMIERFRTGLLMPLRTNKRSVGILSAVEMRHPARRRFEGVDYIFLRCASSRLGGLLPDDRIAAKPDTGRPHLRLAAPLLAAPLTSIYGSVDLIRQNLGSPDERTARYLDNIERAAERIKEFGYQTETVTLSGT